ncbi:hypothetical protein ABEY43_06580 [Priestia megaterium]
MNINDICVVGLGQAGGNIANEFSKRGVLSGAVNFSQADLSSLDSVPYKLKLLGSEGLGHQRSAAIDLISNYPEILINFIKSHFESSEVILIPFGAGGGSGSGISTVTIDLISNMYPDKAVVAIPIIPHNEESLTALVNNQQVFEELTELDCCILPIDNQQIILKYSGIGKSKIYNLTNNTVADQFLSLYNYTDKISCSGSFDKRDFINLFKQKGFCSIAEIVDIDYWLNQERLNMSKKGVKLLVKEVLKQSVYAPLEEESLGRVAIIIDSEDDDIADNLNNSIFEDFANPPLDVFEGIYNHEQSRFVMVALTGLSLPKHRLNQIDKIIKKRQEEIENVSSSKTVFKSQYANLSLSNQNKQKETKTKSTTDILSKYLKR